MHNYSIYVRLHTYTNQKGERQLYIYANINKCRPVARFPLGIYCTPEAFDKKSQTVKNDDYKNSVIEVNKMRALKIFQDARYHDKPLTKDKFLYLMRNNGVSRDFILFMQDSMREEAEKYTIGTFKSWRKTHNRLKEYQKELPMSDIDLKFVNSFDKWLRKRKCLTGKNVGKALSENTITAHHKKLSKFIKIAIRDLNLKIENPYNHYKVSYIEGNRAFLTPTEIKKMVKLYDLKHDLDLPFHLSESLRMFLFMIGSGLRISDSGRLTGLHIHDDTIKMRLQKTKRYKMDSHIPLSEFSRRYLTDTNGRMFKYSECQTLNKNLKTICQYLNIQKEITSHCARHTFATTFLLAGGRIEVLKELLQHSDIRTTMIYVHITQKMERKELKLLDEFLKFE